MIVCVTPNPALDRTLAVAALRPGTVMRPSQVITAAGGKGLNVARTIRILGDQPHCVGWLGGLTGQQVAQQATADGVACSWTWTAHNTRTCTIIIDTAQAEATTVYEHGPTLTIDEWAAVAHLACNQAQHAQVVSICGSLPPGVPGEALATLITTIQASGREVWVDTSGAALRAALAATPAVLKINADEASELLDQPVSDVATAIAAARSLLAQGINKVVLTLGVQGAVVCQAEHWWWAVPPPIRLVSAVGSGDALLGGMLVAHARGAPPAETLCWGVAAGAANATTLGGGVFDLAVFNHVLRGVRVQHGQGEMNIPVRMEAVPDG